MGVWDEYVIFLCDARGQLGYMIDSGGLWFVVSIGSVSCLGYNQVFLVQFSDVFVSSLYDNVCSRGMGCVVQCSWGRVAGECSMVFLEQRKLLVQ